MIISSSNIALQSSHVTSTRSEVSERFEMWVGERNPSQARSAPPNINALAGLRVDLSEQALAANEAEAVEAEADPLDSDPRIALLKNLIELLTGRPLRMLRLGDIPDPHATPAPPPQAPPPGNGNGNVRERAGFGIEYDYSSTYTEHERTTFAAQGVVKTADGQEINFEVAFAMERSYSESVNIQFRAGDARLKDPIVLDFGGPTAALSNTRFEFDLDADGELDQTPMLSGGSGFLAIDRNDNGRIDDGNELFGPTTGAGFAELAALDSDGNGWIDEADAAYAQLRVWQPSAEGDGNVQTLTQAGVGALYLGHAATPFELRGANNETLGVVRSSGVYLRENGSVGTLSQIDLSV
ncbi:MAG: hypothetical protein HYS20_08775 [Rhodocyclales bacterium]|nr:hypothetical protein [Rhodocyclales bacterium]